MAEPIPRVGLTMTATEIEYETRNGRSGSGFAIRHREDAGGIVWLLIVDTPHGGGERWIRAIDCTEPTTGNGQHLSDVL